MTVEFNISATSTKPLIEKYSFMYPYAISSGINASAFDAKKRLFEHAGRVFNQPRRLTKNAGFIQPRSTIKTLQATFFLKTEVGKGNAPGVYLYNQVYGGQRGHKRIEKQLIRQGKMLSSQYFIPVESRYTDASGDMKGPQFVKILSDLEAFDEAGYTMNKKRGKPARFFALLQRRGKLPPGIYERIAKGEVDMIGVYVRKASYRKRYRYFETVEKAVRMTFPREFVRVFQNREKKIIRSYNLAANTRGKIKRVLPLP